MAKCPDCGNDLKFDGEAHFCKKCEIGWKLSALISLSAEHLFPMFEEMKRHCGGWISAQALAMVYNAYAKIEGWPELMLTKEGSLPAMLWNPKPELIDNLKGLIRKND